MSVLNIVALCISCIALGINIAIIIHMHGRR